MDNKSKPKVSTRDTKKDMMTSAEPTVVPRNFSETKAPPNGPFLPRVSRYSTSDDERLLIEGDKPAENLDYLFHPIAHINETKDVLQKLGTVHIVKKRMRFSDDAFERRYIDFIEKRIRARMFLLGVGAVSYSLYSLFFYNFFGTKNADSSMPKHEPLVYSWYTSANVLYNLMWIGSILFGMMTLLVSVKSNVFRHSVERYLQYAVIGVVVGGLLFGNLWRVSRLTNVPFYEAFPGTSDTYPDSDLVMLLGCIVLYLAVVADMRFRRLVWIAMISLVVYSVTVVYFGLPDFKQTAFEIAQAGNPLIAKDANRHVRNLYTAAALTRSIKAGEPANSATLVTDVKASTDVIQPWMLVTQLLCMLAIGLFGKVQLEILQRQNFLELELASKRIDVLEKTINAIDSDSQPHSQLEQTHKRLKDAEKIIQKVRLVGLTAGRDEASGDAAALATGSAAMLKELETVLDVLKETEKTMTILDFQKEVLLGPIKTGHEYKQEEVINWIQNVVNAPIGGDLKNVGGNSATATTQPDGIQRANTANSVTSGVTIPTFLSSQNDLGISAKSLMKRIGVEWNLNFFELEHTLSSNRATDLSSFQLTVRAIMMPYLNNVLLGLTPDIVHGFARAMNDNYLNIPFHNAYHAAAVCHHANILLDLTGLKKHLTGIDRLALSVACLGHNVSHFGRTNSFLVETRHELALRYNDTAVMENFHAAKTFEVIRSTRLSNFTTIMSKKDERRFRNRVIQLILATDTGQHFTLFGEFRMRLLGSSAMFADPDLIEADRRIACITIIKAADLGDHTVTQEHHIQWMERLAEEYAQQGDNERALGLPLSPMCDRTSQDIPSMAISLMNLMTMPMYDELYNMVKKQGGSAEPKMASICSSLINNHSYWESERRKAKDIATAKSTGSLRMTVDGNDGVDGDSAAPRRSHFDSFDIFIPIPKDRTITSNTDISSGGGDAGESPPRLVPVKERDSSISDMEISPVSETRIRSDSSNDDDDDDDDDGPPMLAFNQAHQ